MTDLATRTIPTLAAVANYLGLTPTDVKTQAVVLVANRYGLDPLLNHVAIVKNKVYITRDGMLDVAHRSGQLDGIVVDEERQSENGYSATVTVWRKDMSHPFTYKGGCGVDESQAQEGHGPEMALARAERRALRRAFNIPADDEPAEPYIDVETGEIPAPVVAAQPRVPELPERSDKPSPRAVRPPAATRPEPSIGAVDKSTTEGPPAAWRDGTPMFDPQTGKPL